MSSERYDDRDDGSETATADREPLASEAALRGRLELLSAENERLRAEYARTRQTHDRRTALGLFGIGVVAIVGAVLFPSARTVLLALGGTGLFGTVLLWYLTPERFVAASVGDEIYRSFAENIERIAADLGLSDERVYVPVDGTTSGVRLFVPEAESYTIPDSTALSSPFVVTGEERERGLAVRPSGQGLFGEFRRSLSEPIADDPGHLGEQLTDALCEQFELVDAAAAEPGETSLTVAIEGALYGDLDRIDHPVVSVLAVGVAQTLDRPVTATADMDDDRSDSLVTLRWD